MRLSVSIPTALALASLPILLAAPVPVPHGPGSPHFAHNGALIQRDGDIHGALQQTVDSAQALAGPAKTTSDDAGLRTEHEDNSASAAYAHEQDGVHKGKEDQQPESSVELGMDRPAASNEDKETQKRADISTGSGTGTASGKGAGLLDESPVDAARKQTEATINTKAAGTKVNMIPRVVDSRQRRMKRAPMHLAWMTTKSDIWHTKRNVSEGLGKAVGMTNAERLAQGLGPMVPTKRSTAPNRRSSQVPLDTRQNVIVHVIATDGTDLGPLAQNSGADALVTYDPNTRTPIQFELPGDSPFTPGGGNGGAAGGGPGAGGSFGPVGPQPGSAAGQPFEIRPAPAGGDDIFGGIGRQLLGAIPHVLGDGELKPDSPNFANLGSGQCDQGNPLNLNLPPLPLLDQVGGILSGLPQLLGKIPGLLNLNLGGAGGGDKSGGPLGGLGGLGGLGPVGDLGGPTKGGLSGLLHIVAPGSGSNDAPGPVSSVEGATEGIAPTDNRGPGDEGLLGLHSPSQLLGLTKAPAVPLLGSGQGEGPGQTPSPLTPGAEQGAHSHENPNIEPAGAPAQSGFPLDTDKLSQPVPQPAQTAIWHCDEQGNLGASWTNPDGSNVPAQFFTGGPCAHTICLAADVEALRAIHGGDLAEVHLVAGLL